MRGLLVAGQHRPHFLWPYTLPLTSIPDEPTARSSKVKCCGERYTYNSPVRGIASQPGCKVCGKLPLAFGPR
jgi:hypothetical protein